MKLKMDEELENEHTVTPTKKKKKNWKMKMNGVEEEHDASWSVERARPYLWETHEAAQLLLPK